ncbi:MAG: hypothetical protein HGA22_12790, partial [Clostridiales bacterium]|nr:hypothetical protein [Clostridiales bacterium]
PVPEKLSGPRPIQFVLLFLAVVFLIIIIILLSNLLRIKRRYRSISRLPARESVKHSYSWYLGILSILQPDIQPGESPSEFAARIDRNLVFKFSDRQIEENRFAGEKTIPVTKTIPEKKIISESKSFSCINRIFEDSRYGLDEIEENKKQAVLDFLPVLTSLARERLGSLRFFIYRYFLGRF